MTSQNTSPRFDATERYLELLKLSLAHELYVDYDLRIQYLKACIKGEEQFTEQRLLEIVRYWPKKYEELAKYVHDGFPPWGKVQNLGFSHTMIGRKRLDNIQECVAQVLADGVPGDLIECGVWRGGATVFMRALLEAWSCEDRCVWVADSFEGLPPPAAKPDVDFGYDLSAKELPMLAIDEDTVKATFRAYGLLDDRVRFLRGWFRDTLPSAPIERLAVLRIDGDMYESTWDALAALYDKVPPGGFVIIDDYYFFPTCRQAVDQFREERNIEDPLVKIDWAGAFWRKR